MATYEQVVAEDTPILWWRLDETSGTTANDETGNGWDGTYSSRMTLGEPKLAGSTGYSTFIETAFIPTGDVSGGDILDSVFLGTNPFSVEIWFKPSEAPDISFRYIAAKLVYTGTTQGWGLRYRDDGGSDRSLQFHRSRDGVSDVVTESNPLVNQTVYHIVATYDSTNLRLYRNGTLVGGPTASSQSLSNNAQPIRIGHVSDLTTSANAVGWLDEFAIYDYALSAERVAIHYGQSDVRREGWGMLI